MTDETNKTLETVSCPFSYNTGLGTSPGTWQVVSELLEGEKIPESVSKAINLLVEGRARIYVR